MIINVIIFLIVIPATLFAQRITFRENAVVEGVEIRLKDIAELDSLAQSLYGDHIVGKIIDPSIQRLFRSDEVISSLPLGETRGRYWGAERVRVEARSKSVSYGDLFREVLPFILDSLHYKNSEVVFRGREELNILLFKGGYDFRVEQIRLPQNRGHGTVVVAIEQEGWRKSVALDVTVAVEVEVAKATRDIQRGSQLSPSDIAWEKTDITFMSMKPFTKEDRDYLLNMATRGFLRAGDVIVERHVERVPDIAQGSTIQIIYRNSSIALSVEGLARENGFVGDNIHVQNSRSKQILRARVVAPGRVVVGNYEGEV